MDKAALRRALIEERLNLPDRLQRADLLQQVMRIWLVNRPDTVIGAYWPIKGEFDPLPALHRWKEDGELQGAAERRQEDADRESQHVNLGDVHAHAGCDLGAVDHRQHDLALARAVQAPPDGDADHQTLQQSQDQLEQVCDLRCPERMRAKSPRGNA